MNIENSYYTESELLNMNFLNLGRDVKISRKTGIYVPEKVWIGNNVIIEAYSKISPNVYLNDDVQVGSFCALHGNKGIYLEENVILQSHVCIYSSTSDYRGIFMATAMVDEKYNGNLGEKVVIKQNSKVFYNCCILPGSYIEQNTVILPMSLVRGKISANSIYKGVPADKMSNSFT